MVNKVLVVDDDRLMQKTLMHIIENFDGFKVMDTLSSGEEALSYCKLYEPDIIFMDIMMPGRDGLTIAREIKQSLPNTDICMMSAYQNIDFVKNALKMGIKEYLTKPISTQMIANILNEYKHDEDDISAIYSEIKSIIDAKDFHLVYEKPRIIASTISKTASGKKERIAEILKNIAKNLLADYLDNPYGTEHFLELYPINEHLLTDEIVIDMWLSKVIDHVYKYRFVRRYESVKLVFDFIDEHIKEYVSMLTVIENCHISQQYLLRLFKEQMKMSTLDYMQNRKIMLAKWYFYLGEYSTLDVATMLGYGDVGYFSKIFKKFEGITAYQYKNAMENARKEAN